MFFKKPPRRELVALNLVALIDISALIIIFLIMGAVFGESAIVIPPGLKVPLSENKESPEVAPTVSIFGDQVTVNFLNTKIPLAQFANGNVPNSSHEQAVKQYIASIPASVSQSGILLNVVADRQTSYRTVYDVVRFYRQVGFQSILFVAQGK